MSRYCVPRRALPPARLPHPGSRAGIPGDGRCGSAEASRGSSGGRRRRRRVPAVPGRARKRLPADRRREMRTPDVRAVHRGAPPGRRRVGIRRVPLVRDGQHRRGHDAHVRRGGRRRGSAGRSELVSLRARASDPRVVPRRRSRRARGRLRRRAPRRRAGRRRRAPAEPTRRLPTRRLPGRRGDRVLGTSAESRRGARARERARTLLVRPARRKDKGSVGLVGLRRADRFVARRPALRARVPRAPPAGRRAGRGVERLGAARERLRARH